MVYTVTLNPAIDYTVTLGELETGRVNRCRTEEMTFGGKGINVSAVLSELGVQTKALGFCAGFTGEAIIRGLESAGIKTDFVMLEKGNSRINVKINAGEETEINGTGPDISSQELKLLLDKLGQIADGDVIVLAGSIPASVDRSIYRDILERLSDRKIFSAVDAQGELLKSVLDLKPFVIKPNKDELSEFFGTELTSDEQIVSCAKQLQKLGARNVLVSMAKDGSVLVDEHGDVHRLGVCKGEVISSVGAGDSMLAGFITGYLQTGNYAFAHRLATACGGATAFSHGTAKKELIDELMKQL